MLSITSEKSPIPYLAPFVVYMLVTSFEPEPATGNYPLFYAVKLVLTAIAIAVCFPAWKSLLKSPSLYGILAGIGSAALWIGICQMKNQSIPDLLPGMGLDKIFPTSRPGFDWGFGETASDPQASMLKLGFIMRLAGLAIIVPIIEEVFLRGFVLRYFWTDPKESASKSESELTPWYEVPFGALCPMVWIVTIAYPLLTHPEAIAGVVWFCAITFLASKTRSLSDCICAHSITNLALGLWVLYSGQWYLL